MANVFNGMTFTNIAMRGFAAFNAALTPLKAFTSDFSSELRDQGDKVQTRIYPIATAAVDLQTGGPAGDREDSAVIKDIVTTQIEVTLNQQPISGFSITDEEAMRIGSGVLQDTKDNMIAQHGFVVADSVLNFVFNLITNASFSTAVHVGSFSTFDVDDVVDIGTSVKQNSKWKVGADGTLGAMVLDANFKGALKKDNAVQDVSRSGIDVLRTGMVERLDLWKLMEAVTLPPVGGTPESENLVGFVSKPSAIAMAMRVVKAQQVDKLMFFRVMEDPETGVVFVYRAWYNEGFGKVFHTFETLFGASVGQTEALKRITSE